MNVKPMSKQKSLTTATKLADIDKYMACVSTVCKLCTTNRMERMGFCALSLMVRLTLLNCDCDVLVHNLTVLISFIMVAVLIFCNFNIFPGISRQNPTRLVAL
ncbi:hypothetical protein T01_4952 [Trichinella spiralis]|uniref:Uncharacterized protein n=1 Tax=Trichinella spiralis TaxID=6334 RepID=A0A0V1BF46_TRISP|nr:hypothetical protein T01_4952 [Trichinella spiralis]